MYVCICVGWGGGGEGGEEKGTRITEWEVREIVCY